jgi:hypothetical protein
LDFARSHASALGIVAGEQLVAGSGRGDGTGTHLRYTRNIGDVRIFGGEVIVHVRADGRIDFARGRELPPIALPSSPRLTVGEAEAIARAAVAADPAALRTRNELVYLPSDGGLRIAWEIWLFSDGPATRARVFVDAVSGSVLRVSDLVRHLDGTGMVFVPNPVVALRDNGLTDEDDAEGAVPPEAYSIVTLRDLDPPVAGFYQLSGPYVRAIDFEPPLAPPPLEPTPEFDYSRQQSGFEWVMAYYHIDSLQRFVQRLGFTSACNRRVDVDAHGAFGADNSYYVPNGLGTGVLAFGDGAIDDAEDGEVIAHEYGHAIQDNQCPNCFDGPESGAMGEGWADFLAAAFFSDRSRGFQDACMFDWDTRGGSDAEPACLRRLDSSKRYPEDIVGEVHADGEIWSAALWDVLLTLSGGVEPAPGGRDIAVALALESHMLLPADPSFLEGAQALLDADRVLFAGVHAGQIAAALAPRGLLPILGGGPSSLDCAGSFAYTNPSDPKAFGKNRQVCVDGDPACDTDTIPGQCTFRVAVCFGQRGVAGCSPRPTREFQTRSPRPDAIDPVLAQIGDALTAKIATTSNAVRSGRHGEEVLWPLGLAAGSCAPPADLVVPLKSSAGKPQPRAVTIRTATTPALGKRDFDTLKLVCMPGS